MSVQIRVLLIVLTVFFLIHIIRAVKKGKLRTDYAVIWLLSTASLVVLSIFPQIANFFSDMLGFMAPINMVFSIMIFLLIVLVYTLFVKVSNLEEKQKNLTQEIALLKEKESK